MQAQESLFTSMADLAKLLEQGPQAVTVVNLNYDGEKWDETYKQERIPTARYINIGEIGDKAEELKNMLPTQEVFIKVLKDNNIGVNDNIVTYADNNMIGACRGWWMFKSFGFKNVTILEGLFGQWKAAGHKVETGEPTYKNLKIERTDKDWECQRNSDHKLEMSDVQTLVKEKQIGNDVVLLDARDKKRHDEGHIPGATSMCFKVFMNDNGTFKSKEEIQEVFKQNGVDLKKKIRTSCQTGMSATVDFVAAKIAGAQDIKSYDGSFSQWSKYGNEIGKNE